MIKVILLEKVKNLGNLGQIIDVKSGYARNFLVPRGKVDIATKENVKNFEIRRMELQKKIDYELSISTLRCKEIRALKCIEIRSKSGEKGKLFGSIGRKDIANSIIAMGVKVKKNEIRLPKGVFRHIGDYEVIFQPHRKISIVFPIKIISNNL